jgi:decaprenylphospho-beta-D-ribofuranose 2-oxidase
LTRSSVRAFNELWFRKAPRSRAGERQGVAQFFYPLDAIGHWNRLYGPHGFLQYQFVVPDAGAEVVRTALERLGRIGAPSFLSVLKRFGPGRPESPLSFPTQGWTLAVDLPASAPQLAATLDDLDELVVAEGGRLYLAKDSRAVASTVAAGYPALADFRALRDDVDPDRVFVSDLSRRLLL